MAFKDIIKDDLLLMVNRLDKTQHLGDHLTVYPWYITIRYLTKVSFEDESDLEIIKNLIKSHDNDNWLIAKTIFEKYRKNI